MPLLTLALNGLVAALLLVFSAPIFASYSFPNVDLASGEEITNYQTSPNGKYLVYVVEDTRPVQGSIFSGIYSLRLSVPYRVNEDPIKISGAIDAYDVGRSGDFRISGDSAYVVYLYDHDPDDQTELYSAPIRGGARTLIHGDAVSFKLNNNSRRIVYKTAAGLFSVPVAGGVAPTMLYETNSEFQLHQYDILPNGLDVVLTLKSTTSSRNQISAVPIGGGARIDLDTTNSRMTSVLVSPDSNYIVYFSEPLQADGSSSAGERELVSTPVVGGAINKLNLALVNSIPDGLSQQIAAFKISANSAYVVYTTRERAGQGFVVSRGVPGPIGRYSIEEIRYFRSSISGASPAIELARVQKTRSRGDSFDISGDSQYLVFDVEDALEVDTTPAGQNIGLYSVLLSGGATNELVTSDLDAGQRLYEFEIAPDSSRVVYRSLQDRWVALFSVGLTGDSQIDLSRGKMSGPYSRPDVQAFRLTPGWDKVIYLIDGSSFRIWAAAIDDSLERVLIGGSGDVLPTLNSTNSHMVINSRLNGLYINRISDDLCEPAILGSSVCAGSSFGVDDWNTEAATYPGLEHSTLFFSKAPISNIRLDLVGLTHSRMGDLSIELIAPDGTAYFVVGPRMGDGAQGSGADWRGNYAFADGGVNLRQELALLGPDSRIPQNIYNPIQETDGGLGVEQLNSFVFTFVDGNRAPVGKWKLRFYDSNTEGGTGGLASWRLTFDVDAPSYYPIEVKGKFIYVLL